MKNSTLQAQILSTPLGILTIKAVEENVTELFFGNRLLSGEKPSSTTKAAANQLLEYFSGSRKDFSVNLAPHGTDFQKKVWQTLLTIPYGKTKTYGEIAAQMGNPNASRAVGMANNKNPLSIFIPCHRVIGATGKLVGYGGGLDKKIYLLNLEGCDSFVI